MDLEQFSFSPTLQDLMSELWDDTRTVRIRASKSPINQLVDTLIPADIIECDFPGYAPIENPTWTPELIDDESYAEAYSQDLTFEAGAIETPQSITALYMTVQPDGGAETIRQVWVLPAFILMGIEGQRFTKRVRMFATAESA